jgi:hypothetical protein
MANKKDSKVRDLKAKKDVKGGGPGMHGPPPHLQGKGGPSQGQGTHGPSQGQGAGGSRGGI